MGKSFSKLIVFLLCIVGSVACDNNEELSNSNYFIRNFGGANSEKASDILYLNDGGFLLVGTTTSSNFEKRKDIYVVQTDKIGRVKWQNSYSITNTSNDIPTSVDFALGDRGGFIITGKTNSGNGDDVFVLLIDNAGNKVLCEYNNLNEQDNSNEVGQVILTDQVSNSYIVVGNETRDVSIFVIELNEKLEVKYKKMKVTKKMFPKAIDAKFMENDRNKIVVTGSSRFTIDANTDDDNFFIFTYLRGYASADEYFGIDKGATETATTLLSLGNNQWVICGYQTGQNGIKSTCLAKLKYNSFNTTPWNVENSKLLNFANVNSAEHIIESKLGGFLLVGTQLKGIQNHVFIAKLKDDFVLEWPVIDIGSNGNNDEGKRIIETVNNDIVTFGTLSQNITTNEGELTKMCLVRTNSRGLFN